MTIHTDIDKIFRDGLDGYSEKAPGFVWDNIDQALSRRRFKRRRNALYSMAAAVALLLSFGAGYMFTSVDNESLMADKVEVPAKANEAEINADVDDDVLLNQARSQVNTSETKAIIPANKTNSEIVKPSLPTNNSKAKKSSIKKVNSSGTLLPPMYATEGEYEETSQPVFKPVEKRKTSENKQLNTLDKIDVSFAMRQPTKDINYDAAEYLRTHNDFSFTKISAPEQSAWSIGLSASPLVSYRDIYDLDEKALVNVDNTSSLEQSYQNEKPLVSYSAGVNVDYKLSKRWKIQSGLYFSELGQVSQNINLEKIAAYNGSKYDNYTINTSSGNIVVKGSVNELVQILSNDISVKSNGPAVPGSTLKDQTIPEMQTNFVQTFEYYELPLVVKYKVIDRKFGVSLSGGLSANVLYGNNTYVEESGKRYNLDAEMTDINSFSYSGIVGMGFEYPIVSKLHFNLNPTLRYSLSPLNTEGTVYPYSFGIYTGLKYSF